MYESNDAVQVKGSYSCNAFLIVQGITHMILRKKKRGRGNYMCKKPCTETRNC